MAPFAYLIIRLFQFEPIWEKKLGGAYMLHTYLDSCHVDVDEIPRTLLACMEPSELCESCGRVARPASGVGWIFFLTSTWQKSGACMHGRALHTGSTDFFPPFSVLQPAGGAGLEIMCPLQDYAFYFSDLDVKTHIELYVKMCRTSYSGS